MSRYTPEVQRIVKSTKCPYAGFIVDVVEHEELGYLELRIYRNNLESFSEPQKVVLSEYLFRLRDLIRDVEPHCHIQGVEHDPPNASAIHRGRR